MPKTVNYICSKCFITGSTFSTWGNFVYKIGDEMIPLRRTTGVCHTCNSISPVEILPSENEIAKILNRENDKFASHSFEEEKIRIEAFKNRQTPARCLNCGSHEFDIIPHVEQVKERARSRTPIRTGLFHKNCGGRIYANPFTPNFFFGNKKIRERIFNIEGIEIK